jgi:hypothetical protein
MRRFGMLAAVAAILMWAPKAEATAITGNVTFAGIADPGPLGAGGGNLWSASTTQVNFVSGTSTVQSGTGSFAGTTGAAVTFTSPLIFSSTTGQLWTFNSGGLTYSFSLGSPVSYSFVDPTATITGSGTLAISGGTFTPTAGTYTMTSSNPAFCSSAPCTDVYRFSFQAGSTAVPTVPEPASMLLLGSGLVGIGAAIRRRRRR